MNMTFPDACRVSINAVDRADYSLGEWRRMPWGEYCRVADPVLPSLLFAWGHYRAGHRYYTIAATALPSAVVCECGASYVGVTSQP